MSSSKKKNNNSSNPKINSPKISLIDTEMGPKRSKIRLRTKKIIGRLTYSPEKHKQKFKKSLRNDLASRPPERAPKVPRTETFITFGSLNINGLGHEAHWAVTELIKNHNIDVSSISE